MHESKECVVMSDRTGYGAYVKGVVGRVSAIYMRGMVDEDAVDQHVLRWQGS